MIGGRHLFQLITFGFVQSETCFSAVSEQMLSELERTSLAVQLNLRSPNYLFKFCKIFFKNRFFSFKKFNFEPWFWFKAKLYQRPIFLHDKKNNKLNFKAITFVVAWNFARILNWFFIWIWLSCEWRASWNISSKKFKIPKSRHSTRAR